MTYEGTLTIRSRSSETDGRGLRVERDLRIPGTTWGRFVLHAPPDRPWMMREPHRHAYRHELMCIRGRCTVAVAADGQAPLRRVLEPGQVLPVPDGAGHQVALAPGAILASYVPHVTWLSRPEVIALHGEEWTGCA